MPDSSSSYNNNSVTSEPDCSYIFSNVQFIINHYHHISISFLTIESRKGFQCLRRCFGSVSSRKKKRKWEIQFSNVVGIPWEVSHGFRYLPHHCVAEFLNLFDCSCDVASAIFPWQRFHSMGEEKWHFIFRYNIFELNKHLGDINQHVGV